VPADSDSSAVGAEGASAAGRAGEASSDPGRSGSGRPRRRRDRLGPLGTGIGAAAAVVAILTGVVGVLFEVDPRLAPCLNGADAAFSGAPVFPDTSYVRYAKDHGLRDPELYKSYGSGVEVRYSLHTDDLRGQTLVLYTTVVRVSRDGTVARVVSGEDLVKVLSDTPSYCSQDEGTAILVQTPHQRGARYRVILELYQGTGYDERLAEFETEEFDG
jgi:hypothetical protein